MEESAILAPLAFVIISLVVGALLKLVLNRVNLPYTVGLFVFGLLIGVLNMNGLLGGTPVISEAITVVCNIDPDLILNIFLPILIFSAAYELDVHIFRKTLTNATLLAVPGMVIAMVLTGVLMMGIAHFAPNYHIWDWTYALMFGALISATDPVAVVALLQELGVSKRFSTLIDGESMLNDGTGIVLFMLMFAPLTSTVDMTDPSPVISFLVVVFGGLLIGVLMAKTFLFYATRKGVKGDTLLQTSVMILLSYITFILAQDIFDLSGVIALVAFGLVLAYDGAAKLDQRARDFMKEFWGLLSYVANTLIFIIIGVIIAEKVDFQWTDLGVLLLVYIGINIIRMAMIGVLYPLLKRSGYGLSKRESLILTWGALRGALGLTLALMVYSEPNIPYEIRRQVLLLTSGIVTLTLIINATTIKWMLGKLGLLETSAARQLISSEVRTRLRTRSCDYLEELKGDTTLASVDWNELGRWLPPANEDDKRSGHALVEALRMQVISAERQVVWRLFMRGVIGVGAQRKLISEIDALVDQDGRMALNKRVTALGITKHNGLMVLPFVRNSRMLKKLYLHFAESSPIDLYETAYGLILSLDRAAEIVMDVANSQELTSDQQALVEGVREEIDNLRVAAKEYIAHFEHEMPDMMAEAANTRARRMLHNFENEAIYDLLSEGLIDVEEAETLHSELRAAQPAE